MAMAVWDQLCERAVQVVSQTGDSDASARQLLAASGGNRLAVLAAHMRMAADAADAPDELQARRVRNLLQRAIVLGDTEGLWHPAFGDLDPWQFARHHAP